MNQFGQVLLLLLFLNLGGFTFCELERPKHILLYTAMTKNPNWHLGAAVETQKNFQDKYCQATNCIITTNHSYLPNISDFDVLAFSSWNVESLDVFPAPETRPEDQIYVLHFRERMVGKEIPLNLFSSMINWTMSYHLKADVNLAYGEFIDINTKTLVAPSLSPGWRVPDYTTKTVLDPEIISMVQQKTKLAAWFVSNCNAKSNRNVLVKKMQQYMPVDVYGKCGPLKCEGDKGACREMVKKDYKFYLSFENTLCYDYVTEKVFGMMKQFVIPVVYGGSDYNRILPPGSYINVLDYGSVEELVSYLKHLDANTEEYMKYFWWMDYYEIRGPNFCGLCEKLTRIGDPPRFSQHYTDLDAWLNNGTCFAPETIPMLKSAMDEFQGVDVSTL